jgi:hypothetical protein
VIPMSHFDQETEEYRRQSEHVNQIGWIIDLARRTEPLPEPGNPSPRIRLHVTARAIASALLALLMLSATFFVLPSI